MKTTPVIITNLNQLNPNYSYEVYYFTKNSQTYLRGVSLEKIKKLYANGYRLVSAWRLENGNRTQWYKFDLKPYKEEEKHKLILLAVGIVILIMVMKR